MAVSQRGPRFRRHRPFGLPGTSPGRVFGPSAEPSWHWDGSSTQEVVPLSHTLTPTLPIDQLRANFEKLLPQVERHARYAFRSIKCPHSRDDAIAEVLGLAWRQ